MFGVLVLLKINIIQWCMWSIKKVVLVYSCSVLTKHVLAKHVSVAFEYETNFDNGTAIKYGWIFANFGFWKARSSVQHRETSVYIFQINFVHGLLSVLWYILDTHAENATNKSCHFFKPISSTHPIYNH